MADKLADVWDCVGCVGRLSAIVRCLLFVLRKSAVSLHTKNLGWKFPVRKKGVIDHFSFVRRKIFLAPLAVKLKFHLIPFRLRQKTQMKNECRKTNVNMSQCKNDIGGPLFFHKAVGVDPESRSSNQDPVLRNPGGLGLVQSLHKNTKFCDDYARKKGGKKPRFWVGTTCIQKCKLLPPHPPCLEASTVEGIITC